MATNSLLVKRLEWDQVIKRLSPEEKFSKRRTGTSQWTPIAPTNCNDLSHSELHSGQTSEICES